MHSWWFEGIFFQAILAVRAIVYDDIISPENIGKDAGEEASLAGNIPLCVHITQFTPSHMPNKL